MTDAPTIPYALPDTSAKQLEALTEQLTAKLGKSPQDYVESMSLDPELEAIIEAHAALVPELEALPEDPEIAKASEFEVASAMRTQVLVAGIELPKVGVVHTNWLFLELDLPADTVRYLLHETKNGLPAPLLEIIGKGGALGSALSWATKQLFKLERTYVEKQFKASKHKGVRLKWTWVQLAVVGASGGLFWQALQPIVKPL